METDEDPTCDGPNAKLVDVIYVAVAQHPINAHEQQAAAAQSVAECGSVQSAAAAAAKCSKERQCSNVAAQGAEGESVTARAAAAEQCPPERMGRDTTHKILQLLA